MTTPEGHHSRHYEFEALALGVAWGHAKPAGAALSNSGVVDLGGATLVFDTGLTLGAARDLRAASISLMGVPPGYVANSHWHLDHILGNQVFVPRPIYATRRTIEILAEKAEGLRREISAEQLRRDVAGLESQLAQAADAAARNMLENVLAINRAVLAESDDLRLTPPTHAFEDEFEFPGDRHAKLVCLGGGHTESDSVLFLPDERILWGGDLLVSGWHPNITSGDPNAWLATLERIRRLKPERLVPGHGSVRGPELFDEMEDYLQTIVELARAPGEPGIPARFAGWLSPEQFVSNIAFLRKGASVG